MRSIYQPCKHAHGEGPGRLRTVPWRDVFPGREMLTISYVLVDRGLDAARSTLHALSPVPSRLCLP